MVRERPRPRVQDHRDAQHCAETLGVLAELEQGARGRPKQHVVDERSVAPCQRSELTWKGEDAMEVVRR